MNQTQSQTWSPDPATREILEELRGELGACMQCGTCTASCPNGFAMDVTPRQMWRMVQFGMLVTATVMDLSKQADARAAIDNLAATARLRLRPVYGSQDSAFAAALPLGLVLPKHIKVPAELREKL